MAGERKVRGESKFPVASLLRKGLTRRVECRASRRGNTPCQSDAGSAGIFSRRTNQPQAAQVYSHGGPISRRKRRYILTADQSAAGTAGIFSRRTNKPQEAQVYSIDGGTFRGNGAGDLSIKSRRP
eukprot:1165860-Prorocentrum_minimum.AAC.1